MTSWEPLSTLEPNAITTWEQRALSPKGEEPFHVAGGGLKHPVRGTRRRGATNTLQALAAAFGGRDGAELNLHVVNEQV